MAGGLRRRTLLIAGGGAAALAVAGGATVAFSSIRGFLHDVLVEEFGARVVANAEGERFMDDFSTSLLDGRSRSWLARNQAAVALRGVGFGVNARAYLRELVVRTFLTRTNAYRVWAGLDRRLVYGGINPYEAGCNNWLTAPHRPPNHLAI